jgi:hypothetical protein
MPLSNWRIDVDDDEKLLTETMIREEMLSRLAAGGAFIGCFTSLLGGCASVPDSTVEVRNGVISVCVDVSENKEDKCYKVEEENNLPPKGTATPE